MEGGDATKRDIISADEETSRRSRGKEVMEAGAAAERASISADEETSSQSGGKEIGPSLNNLALMRQATTPNDIWSVDIEDWRDVVYEGVLLEKNTQAKFSFPSAVDIPVPKSKELSWLLIQGRFKTRALSPNTTYEVAFMVKLSENSLGCRYLVKLELDLPDGTKQDGEEYLVIKPKEEWIMLRAGEFKMCPETVGRIYFALQCRAPYERSGLILRGVLIHPKDEAKHNQFDAVEHEFL